MNKKRLLFPLLLILVLTYPLSRSAAQNLPTDFINPPHEFSLLPFWFWNDTLKDEEIIRQIDDFGKHGVYGFVIHPRIGLPQNTGWLSETMIKAMRLAIEEAARRNMTVILYDEGMYPSGSSSGQVVARNPAHAARGLIIEDLSQDHEPVIPEGARLVNIIDRPGGKRVAIMDQRTGGTIRGLHYIGEGSPKVTEETPPAADILNPETTDSFINLVYEKYYSEFGRYFGSTIRGIFTDEPNPLGRGAARDMFPGNIDLLPRINTIIGYDIKPYLSDLWYNDTPRSVKHRSDYLRAVSICLEENYYSRLSGWCKAHGIDLMGHPAGSMDISTEKYFGVPGQDLVWRYVEQGPKALEGEHSTMAKCASSAMVHQGKRRNSNEIYGAYGHNLSFSEVQWLARWSFVRGHNMLFPHAFYYSVRGPRFDERPPDVGPNSKWWNNFRAFAEECSRLSWLNTDSKQVCNIAILAGDNYLPDKPAKTCFQNQYDFNYLTASELGSLSKTDAAGVHIAGMTYEVVIADTLPSLNTEAAKALKKLAASGRLLIRKSAASPEFKGARAYNTYAELALLIREKILPDISLLSTSYDLRYRHLVKNHDDYYLLFNEGEDEIRSRILLSASGNRQLIDPATAMAINLTDDSEIILQAHAMKILRVTGKPVPSGLMTEFIRNPAGVPVMDLRPEFSWVVPPDINHQKAYRIIVSSSPEKAIKGIADIWDSGKTNSSQSTDSEYNGKELSPETVYSWKVMIWDDKDRPTPFSEIMTFKTGKPEGYTTTRNRFVKELISPSSFYVSGEHSYFASFPRAAFGNLLLDLDFVTNDTILVRLGEKLTPNGSVDRAPGGTIRYSELLLPVRKGRHTYRLNLEKDERNTGPAAVKLPDSLGVIMPFRYCEIENCRIPLNSSNIYQEAVWYNFDDNASFFTSSDSILNKVWEISKYTMKATSFAGIYVDGDRERIPYEADAYINQLGHYCTDREYSLARLSGEYFIDHPTWPTEWILHTVPIFHADYMYTGNMESIREYYSELKEKSLVSLAGSDGLIASSRCNDSIMKLLGFKSRIEKMRDIVDWPPAQKDTGWKLATSEGERDGHDMRDVNTVVNAFYIHGLELIADIAGRLGKTQDSIFFTMMREKALQSFNDKLFDKTKGYYTDGEGSEHSSLHSNMLPLAFNLVPETSVSSVAAFVKSRGMACSVYGALYLLQGLYNAGEQDYALQLLNSAGDRSWWNMIRSGASMTMEAWDMKYKPNSDWNHAWGAAPAAIIPSYLWGITPAAPGFSKAVIKPQPGNLKNSTIIMPTIKGTIEGIFESSGKLMTYQIFLPGNMEGEFIVRGSQTGAITLNDKISVNSGNKLILKSGWNKLTITR